MNFTLSTCEHNQCEKSTKLVHICKKCSTTKIISKVKTELSCHEPKNIVNIFIKPEEYNFAFEFNIPNFIRQLVANEKKNFISYNELIPEQEILELNNKKSFNTPSTSNCDNSNSEISEIGENKNIEEEDESDFESSKFESKYSTKKEDLIPISLYYKYRNEIIKIIKDNCIFYKTSKRCFYLTMTYLDIFFKKKNSEKLSLYQMDLIINACFILAYKFIETFEIYEIEYYSFNTNLDKGRIYIRCDDLLEAEINCLEILDYNLNQVSVYEILEMILSAGIVLEKEIDQKSDKLFEIYEKCFNLLDFCVNKNEVILEYPSTEIIFSIIYLMRKEFNFNLNIDKYFHKMYGIEMKSYSKCIKDIALLFYKNDDNIIISQIFDIKEVKEEINLSGDDEEVKKKCKKQNFEPSFLQSKNSHNSVNIYPNNKDSNKTDFSKKVVILPQQQSKKIENYNHKNENLRKLGNFKNVMQNDKKNFLLPIKLCSSYDKSINDKNNNHNRAFLKPLNSTRVINIKNNKNQNERYYLNNSHSKNGELDYNNISSIFNDINNSNQSQNQFFNSNSINKQLNYNKSIFMIPKENLLVLKKNFSNDKNNIKKVIYNRELSRKTQSYNNIFNGKNLKDNFSSSNNQKFDLRNNYRNILSKPKNKLLNVNSNKKSSLLKSSLNLPLIKNFI